MAITAFDIFMARSLRSLAGFCMGEYQKKSPGIHIFITTHNISNNYYNTLCGLNHNIVMSW